MYLQPYMFVMTSPEMWICAAGIAPPTVPIVWPLRGTFLPDCTAPGFTNAAVARTTLECALQFAERRND